VIEDLPHHVPHVFDAFILEIILFKFIGMTYLS
jgi:hypothetical protein